MKYSIILASLNGGKAMKATVESLLTQTYRHFEIVVQDSGSTDGTLALLLDLGDRLLVRSEADSGLCDAWNKALDRADGEWALFLRAGDRLADQSVLERCAPLLGALPESVVFAYGDCEYGHGGRMECRLSRKLLEVYTAMITGMGLPFPATFIRRSVFASERFDPAFLAAGDYEFAARLMSSDNVARLPALVSRVDSVCNRDPDGLLPGENRRVAETRILPKAEDIVRGCIRHMDDEETAPGEEEARSFASGVRRLASAIRRRLGG